MVALLTLPQCVNTLKQRHHELFFLIEILLVEIQAQVKQTC